MHGFSTGTLIWIAIVLFAVISRMVRGARQARQVRPGPRQAPGAPVARPAAAVTRAPAPAQAQAQAQAVAVRRPPPPASPPPPPLDEQKLPELPEAALAPLTLHEQRERRPAGSLTAMFAGRGTMIRAIVAAEVIGPPRALAELNNWSHRHSDV